MTNHLLITECNNSNEKPYFLGINPSTYLIIAGAVGIVWFCWVYLTLCFACICCSTQPSVRFKCIQVGISRIGYPMILFYIIWTGFGLYTYLEQIPSTCQQQDIGKMLLCWCILNLIWIFVLICSICCVGCCK